MGGLGLSGKDTSMEGGRYPCVGFFLSGGGTNGSVVQIRIIVYVGGNDEDSGGNPNNLPKSYNGEEFT